MLKCCQTKSTACRGSGDCLSSAFQPHRMILLAESDEMRSHRVLSLFICYVFSFSRTLGGIVPKAPGARALFLVLVALYRPTPLVNFTLAILLRNARVIILNILAHSAGFCATNADRSARSGRFSHLVCFV